MNEQVSLAGELTPSEKSAYAAAGALLVAAGIRSRSPLGTLGAVLGLGVGYLALRGANPLAPALKIEQTSPGEILVRDAVTINAPAAELYAIWRDLVRLPMLMTHLKKVEVVDDRLSRWTVPGPVGDVSWEAELTADEPGQRIAWRSLPGADIENSGEVLFRPAPGKRGTEVIVRLRYKPPLGSTGAILARISGQEPAQQLRDDLMRFKRERELGYAPTTKGQSSGRKGEQA